MAIFASSTFTDVFLHDPTRVSKDTVLFVVRGMILAHTFPVAIAGREVSFNQDMKAILTNDSFRPWYLYWWLKYMSPKILGLVADSSHGTKRLPTENLSELAVPKSDLRRQDEVVGVFRHIQQNIELVSRHIQATLALLKRAREEALDSA